MEDKKAFGSLKRKLSDIMGAAAVMAKEMDPQAQLPFSMVQAQIEAAYKSLLISEGILFPASALLNKPKQPQVKRSENGWVKLTDAQYSALEQRYGRTVLERAIKVVDEKAQKTGNRNGWKDWTLVIHNAIRDDWDKCRSAPVEAESRDDMILRRFMEG